MSGIILVSLLTSCLSFGQEKGASLATLMHQHTLTALASAPEQSLAATGDMKGVVILRSSDKLAPLALLPETEGAPRSRIRDLSFSEQGLLAIATDWGGRVEVWQREQRQYTLKAYTGPVTTLAWTQSGLLVTGGSDADPSAVPEASPIEDSEPGLRARVKVWKGERLLHTLDGPPGWALAVAVSEDEAWVALGVADTVTVWNNKTQELLTSFSGFGEVRDLTYQGADLVALGAKGVRVLREGQSTPDPLRSVSSPGLAWLKDDRLLSAGYDGFTLFKWPELERLETLPGRAYAVSSSGEEIWVLLSDRVVQVNAQGKMLGETPLQPR